MITCCVIGLGYIGLPTAILLAENNCKVFGVDINPKVVENINSCTIDTNEPNLKEKLEKVINQGSFKALSQPVRADVFVICVPTPFKKQTIKETIPVPNIEYVIDAAKSISSKVQKNNLIIIESTSPVGTTEKVEKIVSQNSGLDKNLFKTTYCPERVIPGRILMN